MPDRCPHCGAPLPAATTTLTITPTDATMREIAAQIYATLAPRLAARRAPAPAPAPLSALEARELASALLTALVPLLRVAPPG